MVEEVDVVCCARTCGGTHEPIATFQPWDAGCQWLAGRRLLPRKIKLELKARKRGAGWVTLWDHALDRDRGFFFFPFKNPRNSYSAQAQQRLPAAVVQDAAVDLANKLCHALCAKGRGGAGVGCSDAV